MSDWLAAPECRMRLIPASPTLYSLHPARPAGEEEEAFKVKKKKAGATLKFFPWTGRLLLLSSFGALPLLWLGNRSSVSEPSARNTKALHSAHRLLLPGSAPRMT